MRLVVAAGPQAGQTVEIDRRVVVGRGEDCDLILDDEKASRRHCALSPNPDGTATLEDLGSSNGTFVDGERIGSPVVVRGGEEMRAGATLLRAEGDPAAQETLVGPAATVVGAPATIAAAAPVEPDEPLGPGSPAAPPPEERPWWRSKWAVIGGAVALLAVGGIVGGVLAATGGGDDDEPVAVATTDEATDTAETETVETETVETETAETETVETETAETETTETETVETETVETETTDTGTVEAGLTPEQEALLAYVPEPLQATCVGNTPGAEELLPGHVAGLHCPTADGIQLFYDAYDSTESMNAAYDGFAVGDVPRGEGDCSAAFPGEGSYTVADATAGRVVCFTGTDPVAPVMWWTTDAINVLASAQWEGHTDRELYDWWATDAGPNP
jgi:pSer/pThr/pTyr-binding forkhead associated (FHA) protein